MQRLSRQLCAALTRALNGQPAKAPEAGIIFWNAFQEISAARSYHASGPNPIPFAEIEAYCRLMALPLEARHVRLITAMDRVWIDHTTRRIAMKRSGVKTLPHRSKEALTPALFDALTG